MRVIYWFLWGFNFFILTAYSATLVPNEVEVLKQIAKTLGKTNWDFSVDPCSGANGWATANAQKGFENNVTCGNCNGTLCHVTGIVLKAQSLPGMVPPEIVKLPFIDTISLRGNRLTGPIPKEITNISTLTDLTLEFNQLSGPLPLEFGNMSSLQRVLISSNNFTGPLPQTLAKLNNMKDFRISDNQFTGKIPKFIQNWTKLQKIAIQASGLEGPIPDGISLLTEITDMRFSDLDGPNAPFPQISNLTSLKTLILRTCQIVHVIPNFWGKFSHLELLDLSFNKLTGVVPNSFSDLSNITFLYLSGNMLSGEVPEWMLKKEESVDLSYNNFTAGATSCQLQNANLFGSSLVGNDSGIVLCLKDYRCSKSHYMLNINCGGRAVLIGDRMYNDDLNPGGPSRFFETDNDWAISTTGNFIDNDADIDSYITQNLSMPNDLYKTARLSPLSLTYYAYCMLNGTYTVNLHFAEIMFTSDETYSSLGRRIFDVYIQGKRVLQDFNIEDEAGGTGKELIKNFSAVVTSKTLEIRLFWAWKGTTGIPNRGVYGPLISAISVDSNFTPPSPPSEGGCKISAGLIAGIVVSVLFVIFAIVSIIWRWKGCLGHKKSIDEEWQ